MNALNFGPAQLDNVCISTIRFLSVDAVEKSPEHRLIPNGAAISTQPALVL
jgi:hypothetical protein